jgi:hypothetical protein
MKKLQQMKSRGIIGGTPCGLGTSWTFKKMRVENIVSVRLLEGIILFKYVFADFLSCLLELCPII